MSLYNPDILGWYYVSGGHQINYPVKGIWECTYLQFAKADFEEGKTERNFVNAVSNAKRALHYQVDALSTAFGWNLLKKKENFPSKLEFLGRCGVIAPNIMRRVNKFRNSIEHDYYLPNQEEVQEYLDIVELYLLATHKIATDYPDQPGAELMSDNEDYDKSYGYPNYLEIYFPEAAGHLKIEGGGEVIIDLDISDSKYFDWVSALVTQSMA